MIKFIKKFLREVNQKGIIIKLFQDKKIITIKKCILFFYNILKGIVTINHFHFWKFGKINANQLYLNKGINHKMI